MTNKMKTSEAQRRATKKYDNKNKHKKKNLTISFYEKDFKYLEGFNDLSKIKKVTKVELIIFLVNHFNSIP